MCGWKQGRVLGTVAMKPLKDPFSSTKGTGPVNIDHKSNDMIYFPLKTNSVFYYANAAFI